MYYDDDLISDMIFIYNVDEDCWLKDSPRFQFSEDFQRADIIVKGNPLVFCCICIPCIPPWLSLPRGLFLNTMVQADSSVNGDHWIRYQSAVPEMGQNGAFLKR